MKTNRERGREREREHIFIYKHLFKHTRASVFLFMIFTYIQFIESISIFYLFLFLNEITLKKIVIS